jgi:hypothetical protein
MKKEIINHLIYWFSYFLFLTIANSLYSFKFWPIYVGGLVGMLLSYADHLLHIFVFKPLELTSQRVNLLIKNKQYKEALILLHDTCDERKDLIFHTIQFQIIFAILTFWVVSSSGNLFARGLVLAYFLGLTLFNLKKILKGELILDNKDSTRIYFTSQVLALFIFGFLI